LRDATRWLLQLDLRPGDVVLSAGDVAAPPCRPALRYLGGADGLFAAAADIRATLLLAPAVMLAEASFRPPSGRAALAPLRQAVALGGPLAPAASARLAAWVKPDLVLLALAGGTAWGDPLAPIGLLGMAPPPPRAALGHALG
jgi:hypothetical protein